MRASLHFLASFGIVLAVASSGAGCRGGDDTTGDMTGTGTGDMAMTTATGGDMAKAYTNASIATMRGGKSGSYQMMNVVAIAVTPSKGSPKVIVQDAAGGDFSAILLSCSSTSSTHPCLAANVTAMHNLTTLTLAAGMGESVTVAGTYEKSKTTGSESFYVDTFTDNGSTLATPAMVTTLQVADIERSASKPNDWFQHVSLTVAAGDTLQMYDWSPSEFKNTSFSACATAPAFFGFGMLPMSSTGTAGMACMGTTQPPSQSMVNASEVLIGTDLYKTFTISSDCLCNATFSNKAPTATTTVVGAISGYVFFDTQSGEAMGYQYFVPDSNAGFPLTNTM